jgi:hypothetical protein
MTRNTSKMLAVLCMGIVFMLGVSCQFHAAPHSHGSVAGDHPDHSEPAAASAADDLSCLVAVVPDIGTLFSLPFFTHDLSHPVVKRLAAAVEFDIPPRFSI